MTTLIGVYGASGSGRGILPLLREELVGTSTRLVFIDDGAAPGHINGHDIMSFEAFVAEPASEKSACIAIGSPTLRAKLAAKCEAAGIGLKSAVAKNVVIMDEVEIGPGACLSPFVTLTSNIKIGKGFHANLYSYVEHDCVIGDFVTFAPGAKCNGNIVIEDYAYIGSNAVIRQGRPGQPLIIGQGAVVGMGAVVTKNVAAGTTVVGNPARILKKD
jgi:sugar O-acyltransferase (sialic acid O-acetyltransferase NeuD family)